MARTARDFGFTTKKHKDAEFLRRRRASLPTVEGLESRELLTTLIGLGNANNLITFDSATPGTVQSTFAITGEAPGESIVSIANRPSTGALLGVGSQSHLYSINLTNGVATAVSSTPFNPSLVGSRFAISTNPVTDTVRLVDDAGQNLRLNPATGTAQAASPLAYATGDPNAAAAPNVVALAHTNNSFGVSTTPAYGIDAALHSLVRLGPPGAPNAADTGQLSTVGPLGVNVADTIGFDIVGGNNVAYAALTVPGSPPGLYSINLASGSATRIGTIFNGTTTIIGLAAVNPPTPAAPTLAASSDSGVSNSDHITNINTPTIQGTALANANIIVLANGVNVGMGTADPSGNYSIRIGPALADGTYTVQVVQSDASGLFSGASSPLSPQLVIKTSAPAPGVPTLFPAADTGFSNTDHFTRVNNPAFYGTGEVGDTVRLFANGQVVGQGPVQAVGQYAVQSTPLPDGSYQITVNQTDVAGNTSAMSAPLSPSLVIVTTNRPTPGQSFFNQLYHDLLDRPADQTAFDNAMPLLSSSDGRTRIIRGLFATSEYRQEVVRVAYQTYLHRTPEASALTIGDNYLLTHTDEQLRAILIGSHEYYNLHGGTNSSFLAAAYLDLVGRPIDSAGQARYLGALNGGASLLTAATLIIQSPEGMAQTAANIYQNLLHRRPDTASLTNVVNLLSGGGRDEDLIAILAASPEYYQNSRGSDLVLDQWGRQVFLDLLQRPADASGFAALKTQVIQGDSTYHAVQSLQNSDEYRTLLVNQAYQTVLRRAPDASGLAGGLAFLRGGGGFQALEVGLYGSQEYFNNIGGGTNSGYLAAIYNDIVGRPIDPGANTSGLLALSLGTSRGEIAASLQNSAEGSQRIVQHLFLTYLRRPITFSEATSIADRLGRGTLSYTDLVAGLIGSQEYFSGL